MEEVDSPTPWLKPVVIIPRTEIMEEVDSPTPWLKPVVIIPRTDGDIWLCIDVHGCYPIPTVDGLSHNKNGCKVFSKLLISIKVSRHSVFAEFYLCVE